MAIEKIDNYAIHENPSTNKNLFDIENYLNANWRKTKQVINNNADELTQSIEKIKSLEEDNTTNKEDIKNIKAKDTEQDKNIENTKKENIELKEENQRLRADIEANSIIQKASGENITIENASGARFKKFEVFGNSKQESREGYNKFKPFETSKIINANGVTAKIVDEKIILNGTCTKDFWLEVYINLQDGSAIVDKKKEELDIAKTYTFALKRISGDITAKYINATIAVDANDKKIGGPAISTTNKNGTSKTFTGGDGIYRAYLYVPINTVLSNLEFGILVYEGTEEKEWEKYGAMPSIEFPSEVRAVENKVNAVISNKNFLKITETSKKSNGITTTLNNNKMTAKGTVSSNWFNLTSWGKCFIPANTYTISYDNVIQGRLVAKFKYADGRIKDVYINPSYKKISFTLEKNAVEFMLNIDQLTANDKVNFETNIQLEQGTVATEIVFHEEQNYIIPIQEKMFSGDSFIKQNNIWYEKHIFSMFSTLNNPNVKINTTTLISDTFYRHHLAVSNDIKRKKGSYIKIMSTHFKFADSRWGKNEGICGWEAGNNFSIGTYNKNYDTVEKMNDFISKNDVKIYYELETPKLIECTEEQKKVLEQIEKTVHSYKETTHIYSTDEICPIFEIECSKDIESVINNISTAIL